MKISDLYFVLTDHQPASLVASPPGLLGFTSSKEAYQVAENTDCPPYSHARVVTADHWRIGNYLKRNSTVYVKEPDKAPYIL